jgi:hypothetical protein
MPKTTDIMACQAVKPMPMREEPMVKELRQMPQVPILVSQRIIYVFTKELTPICHIGINTICPLV